MSRIYAAGMLHPFTLLFHIICNPCSDRYRTNHTCIPSIMLPMYYFSYDTSMFDRVIVLSQINHSNS